MLLSARILSGGTTANSLSPANQFEMTYGDTVTVYFQLIDASLDKAVQGFSPAGRRYVPAVGAILQVNLLNIDNSKQVNKTCTQPFVGDSSIWSFTISNTDLVQGTVNMKLILNQSSVYTYGWLQHAISVSSQDPLL